jgi:hypothetical protein
MTGSRGAVTGDGRRRPTRTRVAGESRRNISYANALSSENVGQLLVNSSKRDYNMVVLLHLPFKQNALGLATEGVPNSRKGGYPMRKLVISCHFTTSYAIQIPPILRIAGDIATSGGAS